MYKFVFGLFVAALSVAPALAQDAASGEKIFAQCRACHQIGENAKNAVGPHLNGLFGRKAGTIEGYSYTPANKNSGLTWDEATFRDYIKDPKAKIPGTKMVYAGLKDEKRIEDLIAYMKQFDATGKKTAQLETQPAVAGKQTVEPRAGQVVAAGPKPAMSRVAELPTLPASLTSTSGE